MKATAIYCFIGLITFAHSKNLDLPKEQLSQHFDSKRQPLVSPEDDASWDDYKRIKRQEEESNADAIVTATNAVKRFQEFVWSSKKNCGAKLGFTPEEIEKPLLFEQNPTQKEKCLMACVQEQTKIINADNKVSVDTIGNIASMISNKNELIIAIARATADNCNRFINSADKCEAAAQINRCIAHGLKKHKVQIIY